MLGDPVKSTVLSMVKRRLGKVPSIAFSIESDFEPTPNVKVLRANVVMYYQFIFSKALA